MIPVDKKLSQPLHRQVYAAFRAAIVDGRLRPGQRVPSTRLLASEIGVSRFPVLNAYAQLLAEGYLQSRIGAGTVISSSLPEQMTSAPLASAKKPARSVAPRVVARRCSLLPGKEQLPWMLHFGPFRVGEVALERFPMHIWSALAARRARDQSTASAHYGDLLGHEALRQAIANYLRTARSVRCEARQILIVNGSQQALEIAVRVLLNPGDRVWIEDPSYRLARDVFTINGCDPIPVPVDAEGLDVSAGIAFCRRARAAFVTPSHQFPLGVTMSASRRLQLVEWANQTGAWILEDDYDSEYRYQSLPIASLQGLDTNSRVIYVGTFSKVLFPALRLGYLVVPPDLIERFFVMRRVMDLGPPTLPQRVLADFIEEGHFARHIRRMRMHYGELRRTLAGSLGETFGETLKLLGDEAGMHLTVMPEGVSDDENAARRAVDYGLSLWPLSRLYQRNPRQGFILGFGGTTSADIPPAVRKLSHLLAQSKNARLSNFNRVSHDGSFDLGTNSRIRKNDPPLPKRAQSQRERRPVGSA